MEERTMRLEWLRCFYEVAQTASFTKAAQNLYTTQPAVTKIIRALETEAGEKLFLRSTAGVQLTEAGKIFRRFAYKVLNDYDQYQIEMRAHQEHDDYFVGTIELAVAPLILQTYYGDIVEQMGRRFPEAELHFIESSLDTAIGLIKDNPQTLGLVYLYPAIDYPFDPSIVVQELVSLKTIFCVSVQSPYAGEKDLCIKKLPRDKLISIGVGKYNTAIAQGAYNFYTTNLALIAQKLLTDPEVCVQIPQNIAEKALLSEHIVQLDIQDGAEVWIAFVYNRAALDLNFYAQSFLDRFQKTLKNIFAP